MNQFRKFIEIVSRDRVIKRRIKLNGVSLPVYVTPDSQLKYLKLNLANVDLELVRLCEEYLEQGDCAWDIGANIGFFSFVAANSVGNGSVVAVEPDLFLAGLLEKTAKLEHYKNTRIEVLPAAVSSTFSISRLRIANRGRASNSLEQVVARTQMGGVRKYKTVATVTLDSLLGCVQAPNLVKIDIEGAELEALKGAKKLLSDVRPVVYVELGREVYDQVMKLMNEANYTYYAMDASSLGKQDLVNILFRPK